MSMRSLPCRGLSPVPVASAALPQSAGGNGRGGIPFLAKSGDRRENIGAAPPERVVVGEEQGAEIERRFRPGRDQHRAALPGDVGEAGGDISASGEDDALDPGTDRALRGAGIVAAIEQRGCVRRRYRAAAGGGKGAEPARTGTDA